MTAKKSLLMLTRHTKWTDLKLYETIARMPPKELSIGGISRLRLFQIPVEPPTTDLTVYLRVAH